MLDMKISYIILMEASWLKLNNTVMDSRLYMYFFIHKINYFDNFRFSLLFVLIYSVWIYLDLFSLGKISYYSGN